MQRTLRTSRRLKQGMARLFRPRELLVRSNGRIHYIVLSTGRQAAVAGLGLAVGGWLAVSSSGLLIQDKWLGEKELEIQQAKTAYLDLLAEIGESYERASSLSDGLAADPRLSALPDYEDEAEDAIASIEAYLQWSRDAQGHRLAEIGAPEERLRRFGADLSTLASHNEALSSTVAMLQQQLQDAAADRAQVAHSRQRLWLRLNQVETELAGATMRNGLLESNLADLETQLAAARESGTGSPPGPNVASLQRRPSESPPGELTLEDRIDGMLSALAGMVGQRDTLQAARAELSERVEELESRLAALQESQDAVMQRLAERTRSGVDEVEKTVTMTGLDVEMLLSRAAEEWRGVGGPFVPVGQEAEGDLLLASVASLDDAVQRWEKLQFVLRTLPLTAPVDHYYVSSVYGERKDPVTGKRAVHQGIDLSGAMKTPVLSTAPGRVVFAGRKGSYGRLVEIDHGLGIRTRYAHLHSVSVSVGDVVDYRDKIGLLGSSGRSTGPHLHYEIIVDGKAYDPMKFFKAGRYVFKG